MTPPAPVSHPLLIARDGRDAAADLLTTNPMTAVARLSAHVAAFATAVLPTLQREVGRDAAAPLRRSTLSLEHALRALELQLSGDMAATGAQRTPAVQLVATLARETGQQERALLARLGAPARQELQDAYCRALRHSPTRPHPSSPHGALAGAARRLNTVRDRLMDVLDSRESPHGRLAPRALVSARQRRAHG